MKDEQLRDLALGMRQVTLVAFALVARIRNRPHWQLQEEEADALAGGAAKLLAHAPIPTGRAALYVDLALFGATASIVIGSRVANDVALSRQEQQRPAGIPFNPPARTRPGENGARYEGEHPTNGAAGTVRPDGFGQDDPSAASFADRFSAMGNP